MLTKIYMALWFTVVFAAGLVFLTGNLNMPTTVVFGFIIFGLVFMGMMSVLPASMAHPKPVQHAVSSKEPQVMRRPKSILERIHASKAEWMTSNGVEIRKPKYP